MMITIMLEYSSPFSGVDVCRGEELLPLSISSIRELATSRLDCCSIGIVHIVWPTPIFTVEHVFSIKYPIQDRAKLQM